MKTSYILMIVTVITKIFGFLREKILAQLFGVSKITDIFQVVFRIPMTFTNITSGATANGYIPIYEEIKDKISLKKANEFTSNLVNITFVFVTMLAVIGIIYAEPFAKALAPGFGIKELKTTIFMLRCALLSITATSVFSILKAYLQIKKHFIISVIHAILMNAILIIAMYISYKMGKNYLGYGIFLAFVFQYIIFIPYIRKTKFNYKFIFNLKDNEFRKLLKIIIPIIISTSVVELNFIISNSIASSLFKGAISTLNYAYQLQSFVTGIVVTSVITVVYPTMAKFGIKGDFEGLKETISKSLSTMALLVIPSAVGLCIFSKAIVDLLFLGGKFSEGNAVTTGLVLAIYSIGIIGIAIRELISRAFYTMMDSRTPVINSVIMVIINVTLSFILASKMGIQGLAFATSISFLVGAFLIYMSLRMKIKTVINKESAINIFKIIIASIIMGVLSKSIFIFLKMKMNNNISFLISVFFAMLIYAIVLILFKENEINGVLKKLKKHK